MSEVKDFWKLDPLGQQAIKEQERQAALEKEADEKHMLILNGKLIKPEDWPCECELEEAEDCYEQRKEDKDVNWSEKEIKDEYCWCPCHTYAEGW